MTLLAGSLREGPEETDAPEQILRTFVSAINAGDVARAGTCLAREACVLTPDRTVIHGRRQIARVLNQLVSRRTEIEIDQLALRRAGEVALGDGIWIMHSDGPAGSRFSQIVNPALVLQKIEGAWRIAILSPWLGVGSAP